MKNDPNPNSTVKAVDEKEIGNRDSLSWGAVVSKETLGTLTIPKNSLEVFSQNVKENYILVIFSPTKNCLKIEAFPVDSKKVLKLQLVLKEFSQKVFQGISEILRELNLQKLFTTGVCIRDTKCIYEAYIEEAKLSINKEQVIQRFQQIENVIEVILTPID